MDITEQLRKYECTCTNEQCRSCAAADEIERLQKLVLSLRLDLIACHGELMGTHKEDRRD